MNCGAESTVKKHLLAMACYKS